MNFPWSIIIEKLHEINYNKIYPPASQSELQNRTKNKFFRTPKLWWVGWKVNEEVLEWYSVQFFSIRFESLKKRIKLTCGYELHYKSLARTESCKCYSKNCIVFNSIPPNLIHPKKTHGKSLPVPKCLPVRLWLPWSKVIENKDRRQFQVITSKHYRKFATRIN